MTRARHQRLVLPPAAIFCYVTADRFTLASYCPQASASVLPDQLSGMN